jgi:phosphoglycerate kinase
MAIRTLEELPLEGKRILVRVDYNVPLADGQVADDTRVRASLPTLRELRERARQVVLMSHLGRPKGQRKPEYSLAPVAKLLSELLGEEVAQAPDCIGDEVARLLEDPGAPRFVLLENLRFHPGEEADDEGFARELARWGEVYVNDAFGAAHRAHASIHAVANLFRDKGMGRLLQKELEALGSLLHDPAQPFVALLGGAKVSGKVEVLENLLGRARRILVGGAMAFTFLRAQGHPTGRTLVEEDLLDLARRILEEAAGKGTEVLLPEDALVSRSAEAPQETRVVAATEIGAEEMAVDIGPRTVERFREALADARTIFWNGPMGIFEVEAFREGTMRMAEAVAERTRQGAKSIVGGGDSVAALELLGLAGAMTHVSTGGGASLEFVAGRTLPGVAALETE